MGNSRWNQRSKKSQNYLINPAPGFRLFDLTQSGTLKDKMNAWQKDTFTAYDLRRNKVEILADFIDQSIEAPVPNGCANVSPTAQQTPANNSAINPLKIYSFYACVDSSLNLAQVYLRGNALARIEREATYSDSRSDYFPSGSVQVKSRDTLSNK